MPWNLGGITIYIKRKDSAYEKYFERREKG